MNPLCPYCVRNESSMSKHKWCIHWTWKIWEKKQNLNATTFDQAFVRCDQKHHFWHSSCDQSVFSGGWYETLMQAAETSTRGFLYSGRVLGCWKDEVSDKEKIRASWVPKELVRYRACSIFGIYPASSAYERVNFEYSQRVSYPRWNQGSKFQGVSANQCDISLTKIRLVKQHIRCVCFKCNEHSLLGCTW